MDHAPFDPKGDKLYEEGGWDRHVKLDAPKEEAVDGIKGPPDKNNCKTLQKLLALKGRPVLVVFYCQSATIRSPCAAAWYANKYVLPNKYPNKQAAELLDKQYIAVLHGGISSIDGALRLIKGKDSKDEAKEKDQDKYYHKENKELPCPCTTEQME